MASESSTIHVLPGNPFTMGLLASGQRRASMALLIAIGIGIFVLQIIDVPTITAVAILAAMIATFVLFQYLYVGGSGKVVVDLERNTLTCGRVSLEIPSISIAGPIVIRKEAFRSTMQFVQPGCPPIVLMVPRSPEDRDALAEVIRRSSIELPRVVDRYDPDGRFATVGQSDYFFTKESALAALAG